MILSKINRPRFTGEVRSGFDVTTNTAPSRQHAAAGAVFGQFDSPHLRALSRRQCRNAGRAFRSGTCSRNRSDRARCGLRAKCSANSISTSCCMARRRSPFSSTFFGRKRSWRNAARRSKSFLAFLNVVQQLAQFFIFAGHHGLFVDRNAFDVAHLQPLADEILHEGVASDRP